MSKVVNLRQARKRRGRDAARSRGDENAARFGRAKADREQADREAALTERRLDGHKRDDERPEEDQ